jgi:hypothetical protein
MLTPLEIKLVDLCTAKELYEVGMLDDKHYIRTVNDILEQD